MTHKTEILKRISVLISIYYLIAFLGIALFRLTTPFELEWMEGGMIAHALRLREGLGIYIEPSLDFVPFFYTPGYPFILYLLDCIGLDLSFTVARSVSLLSSVGTMSIIYYVVHRESHSRYLALLGVGFYCALFRTTGAFYDLARPDALLMLLLAATITCAYYARSFLQVGLAALLISSAFFTKQTGAVFFPIISLWLLWKNKGHGLTFVFLSLSFCSGGIWFLNQQSDGAFWQYIFEGHQGHIFYWKNILLKYWRDIIFLAPLTLLLPLLWFSKFNRIKLLTWFLVLHWSIAFLQRVFTLDYPPHMYYRELFYELPRVLIVIPPLCLVFLIIKSRQWHQHSPKTQMSPYWLWIYIAGTGASGLNHSTQWAYSNCFMLLGLAFSFSAPLMLKDLLSASGINEEQPEKQEITPIIPLAKDSLLSNVQVPTTFGISRSIWLYLMILTQLVAWAYSPLKQVPKTADINAWYSLTERLNQFPAPIFFPGHPIYNATELGLSGKKAVHTHQMGIRDVAYRGGVADLRKKLSPYQQQDYIWSAIISHERTQIPYLETGYYEANRWYYIQHDSLRAKTGFLTRPQSLWLPRIPSSPRYGKNTNQNIILNFEIPISTTSKVTSDRLSKDLVWSELGWQTQGTAFGHQPRCSHIFRGEGHCGASSLPSKSAFQDRGTLRTHLMLKADEHLSILVKGEQPQVKRRAKLELRLKDTQGKILTKAIIRANRKWYRQLLIPRPTKSFLTDHKVVLEILDLDQLAGLVIDDIKIDRALDR